MAATVYNEDMKREILGKFFEYIDGKENPIIAEFAYLNDITRETLYWFAQKEGDVIHGDKVDIRTFSYALKKAVAKSETFLLNLLDSEQVKNPAGAIFRLKAQHGYRDSEPAPAASVVNVNVTDLAKKEDDELESLISGKIAPKPAAKRPKSAQN